MHAHVAQVLTYTPQVLTPSGLGKVSPHVMAFAPGATLLASLDTRIDGAIAEPAMGVEASGVEAAASAAGSAVLASISYVSSYENQGRLAVRCTRGCWCAGLLVE